MSNILEVKNIEKYYGNKTNLTKAIDNISFNVEKGEFVGIMGASGSGKTTLLNCISTIDKVTAGKIIIDGKDITKLKGNNINKFRREELGFIFQDFNLLDTLTAYENIALALTIQKVKPHEKNHSTVKDVAITMNKLNIKNLLLWHCIDNNIENRKELFTKETKEHFQGNVYVPDDLDEIEL